MTTLANTVGVGRLVKPLKLLAIFRVELSIYQRVMGKSSKKKKKHLLYIMCVEFLGFPHCHKHHKPTPGRAKAPSETPRLKLQKAVRTGRKGSNRPILGMING
jgi:hypothetical protein